MTFILDDFQNTLKSSKSQGTTEAVSPNVSDPASGSQGKLNSTPPQHNYSNVQHPISRAVSNGGSLTSSRTQSSNASPALAAPDSPLTGGSMQPPQPPNIPPPPVPVDDLKVRMTEERLKQREQLAVEEVRKSKLVDVQDLIHLTPPLSEDLVLRTLQARFFNKCYFVSFFLQYFYVFYP